MTIYEAPTLPTTLAREFRKYRREYPDLPAALAFSWAKQELALRELAREVDWEFSPDGSKPSYLLAIGRVGDVEIRAYIDDEPYEWGDAEPSDDERRQLEVIGVGVRVTGDDEDLDAIWGCGYLHGDFEREAMETSLTYGIIDQARTEISERERLAGYVETVS